jgi:hypothetical protein
MTPPWKLAVAFAVLVGLGTWVGLGFLWMVLFVPQPGTLQVLDRAASDRDVLAGDYASLSVDLQMENVRFLGTYQNSNYFVAPSVDGDARFCLITEPVVEDGVWEVSCARLIDGRDVVVQVSDPEGRRAVLVPDQFDNGMLEADGWIPVHKNLLVQPKPTASANEYGNA